MAKSKFELYQLRCFVAVAEELNFRRAAERLHMTQPPLSRQIRLLEEGIGLRLLDRTSRSVRLTPAGESFQASAVDLLQRAEHAILTARQAERGERGAIALGFVPSAALEFVPRIVAAIARDLPDVTFRPTEMMSYEILEALASGQLDLGLTRMNRVGGGIVSTHVVSEPFVLALFAGHPLTRAHRILPADLDGLDYVGYSDDRGGHLRTVQTAIFASAGIAPRIVHEVSQTHTVAALVDQGLGIALVPRSARALGMRNLVFRDLDLPNRFRSDLYLANGPSRRPALIERVRIIVRTTLAGFQS